MWPLLVASKETGKKPNTGIWLFSLNDGSDKRKGVQNGFRAANQRYLPHVLILVPKRPNLVTRMHGEISRMNYFTLITQIDHLRQKLHFKLYRPAR